MSDAETARIVARWLRFADDDLRGAEAFLGREDLHPRLACFHAQQAAEKAMKVIYVFEQIDYAFTHDLDRLRNSLPKGWTFKDEATDLSSLSVWAVQPRYPGDLPEATEAEAAVEEARKIYETTLEDLERHGYIPSNEGAL
ncbi:MAG: HEPN domain-containing protein [Rubrobacter sp.]|nr:HEPN domain-containing protein [Rubrobacter sp.]